MEWSMDRAHSPNRDFVHDVGILSSLAAFSAPTEASEAIIRMGMPQAPVNLQDQELADRAFESLKFVSQLPPHIGSKVRQSSQIEVHAYTEKDLHHHLVYSQDQPVWQRPGLFLILHGTVHLHQRPPPPPSSPPDQDSKGSSLDSPKGNIVRTLAPIVGAGA